MIITNEHEFSVWRDMLRKKMLQTMIEEYGKLQTVLGFDVDQTAKTTAMESLYPFDERVEADLMALIDDAFWQISRDLAREEAA
jgi:16S rRNA C1402 N4-methylase RsmH